MLTTPTKKAIQLAYEKADAAGKELICILYEYIPEPKSITDRVNSIDDVLQIVGLDKDQETINLLNYNGTNRHIRLARATLALSLIATALNEEWVADFTDSNQWKYYVVCRPDGSGLALHLVGHWYTFTYAGARLAFASDPLARFAFSKFKIYFQEYFQFNIQ
jgi:hypothetical protein